ncbi:unnamed protein product [marine sediment metagenome]|uniref:Polymerase beta nucleotidyltransferase domain-containing protein n=1 Tax=marine sediment metagenome TaxID=412755 RepID=X1CT53_9ZZZZ
MGWKLNFIFHYRFFRILLKRSETGIPVTPDLIAFIYGSFASGKETERSDIDLFLIGEFDEDLLNKKLRSLEQYLAREITYTSMKKSEFKEEKQKKFKFLRTLLNEPKLFLIGDENELQRLS